MKKTTNTALLAGLLTGASALASEQIQPSVWYSYTYDLSSDIIDLTIADRAIDVSGRRALPAGSVRSFGMAADSRASSVRTSSIAGGPILVRTSEDIPLVAIDPARPIDDNLIDELQRQRPWIRRTGQIQQDLRTARNRYLKQTGQILTVTTFGGKDSAPSTTAATAEREPEVRVVYVGDPTALPDAAPERRAESEPVIRAHDPKREAPEPELNEDSVIRVRPS